NVNGDSSSLMHYIGPASSASDDIMTGTRDDTEAAGGAPPVMTTSGAAALAAAQAAANAAQSGSSKTPTPQRSRGGSATQLSALYAGDSDSSDMMDVSPTTMHDAGGQGSAERPDEYPLGGFDMSVDDADETMQLVDGDVESRLVRRVASSEERLSLLLRLLATCQEYWADHDYVHVLHEMLQWPDEWTTSMHMLERLLLELRID
ncbi:hypothetical protein EV175_006073, partial [Coemansia sp. RSA 1933]